MKQQLIWCFGKALFSFHYKKNLFTFCEKALALLLFGCFIREQVMSNSKCRCYYFGSSRFSGCCLFFMSYLIDRAFSLWVIHPPYTLRSRIVSYPPCISHSFSSLLVLTILPSLSVLYVIDWRLPL